MIRIDGGFLILNFQKYRDRDYTTAERSARYRTRKQQLEERSSRRDTVTPRRDITQAEAEVRSQKSEIRNNPRAPNESAQVGSQAELIPRTAEPAKQPKERPRDPLFDALASALVAGFAAAHEPASPGRRTSGLGDCPLTSKLLHFVFPGPGGP